jgi:hypothetical protein
MVQAFLRPSQARGKREAISQNLEIQAVSMIYTPKKQEPRGAKTKPKEQ